MGRIVAISTTFWQTVAFDLQGDPTSVDLSEQHDAPRLCGLYEIIKHDEQFAGLNQHSCVERSRIDAL
jgi:hypothetical protein